MVRTLQKWSGGRSISGPKANVDSPGVRESPGNDHLQEMAFMWSDIERDVKSMWPSLYEALRLAYRVEAVEGENSFGDPHAIYDLYFNGENPTARTAARRVKNMSPALHKAIGRHVSLWDFRFSHEVRVLGPGRSGDGIGCERLETVGPLDALVMSGTQVLDSASVSAAWTKAIDRRTADPEGAITAARTLLESTCKTILDDRSVPYAEKDDLPALYKAVQGVLNLSPSDHTETQFKAILGACTTVVKELGSLRKRISDSHGPGRKTYRPAERHAALAVNLAGSMALFLMETHEARGTP